MCQCLAHHLFDGKFPGLQLVEDDAPGDSNRQFNRSLSHLIARRIVACGELFRSFLQLFQYPLDRLPFFAFLLRRLWLRRWRLGRRHGRQRQVRASADNFVKPRRGTKDDLEAANRVVFPHRSSGGLVSPQFLGAQFIVSRETMKSIIRSSSIRPPDRDVASHPQSPSGPAVLEGEAPCPRTPSLPGAPRERACSSSSAAFPESPRWPL